MDDGLFPVGAILHPILHPTSIAYRVAASAAIWLLHWVHQKTPILGPFICLSHWGLQQYLGKESAGWGRCNPATGCKPNMSSIESPREAAAAPISSTAQQTVQRNRRRRRRRRRWTPIAQHLTQKISAILAPPLFRPWPWLWRLALHELCTTGMSSLGQVFFPHEFLHPLVPSNVELRKKMKFYPQLEKILGE